MDTSLVVTSHPDDECMFFVPIIRALKKAGTVHLLCLSTGNADGFGNVRRQELFHSCSLLDIPRSCVHLVDDEGLLDGQRNRWSEERVRVHVKRAVDLVDPSIVRYGCPCNLSSCHC